MGKKQITYILIYTSLRKPFDNKEVMANLISIYYIFIILHYTRLKKKFYQTYAQDHLGLKLSSEEMSIHAAFFNNKSVIILPHA